MLASTSNAPTHSALVLVSEAAAAACFVAQQHHDVMQSTGTPPSLQLT